jgi:hypothetical protein
MTIPPEKEKSKNTHRSFVREPLTGADNGCLRGIIVFIGLLLMFGFILYVMSQL